MVRQIKLNQIDDVMKEVVIDLVQATTLNWTARVKKATPVFSSDNYTQSELDALPEFFRQSILKHKGGDLRAAWQTKIQKFKGTITNNLPYAEPVCFGINLPPTWGGQYKTRQGTVPGFPELIAKELTTNYIPRQLARIVRKK